jgi:predicted solute-binding protein
MDEIIESEHAKRGIARELADVYLRKHIRFMLGEREMEGLRTFLQLAGLVEGKNAYATTGN